MDEKGFFTPVERLLDDMHKTSYYNKIIGVGGYETLGTCVYKPKKVCVFTVNELYSFCRRLSMTECLWSWDVLYDGYEIVDLDEALLKEVQTVLSGSGIRYLSLPVVQVNRVKDEPRFPETMWLIDIEKCGWWMVDRKKGESRNEKACF